MGISIVLIIASNGYQNIEFSVPKKILEQAGFMVTVASDRLGKAVAADGSTTQIDTTIDKVIVDQFGAIVFIGGPGAMEHLDNEKSYILIKQAHQAKKVIGAICISPRIIAKAGVLKNRRATGWDGDGNLAALYQNYGVVFENRPVVVDGLFITASGPSAAQEFGTKIVEKLS